MKPKDIFSLVVRLLGLVFLYQGLSVVPMLIVTICSVPLHLAYKDLITRFLMMIWQLAVAWWMIRGAPQLARLAYPDMENLTPVSGPHGKPE